MTTYLSKCGSALVGVAFLASVIAPAISQASAVSTSTTAHAHDISTSTTENTPVDITLLGSTTDASSTPSYNVTSSTTPHGSVSAVGGANMDTVTYSPTAGYTGADTFTYTVSDNNGSSTPGTVTINVAPSPSHLVLTVPDITVGTTTLASSTNGKADSNAEINAAVAGMTPLTVTLSNTGGTASGNVRIAPVGDTTGHIQLWAKDSNGDWYDVNVTGWGPASGFPVAASSTNSTDVYAFSDQPGTYTATVNVVDPSNNNVLASDQGTVTVTGSTTTGGGTGGTSSSTPPTIVVTPSNLQGWTVYNDVNLSSSTSTTATSTFVSDPTSPLPPGALEFSTPGNSDEIMFDRTDATMTPVADINLSYATKRLAGATYAAPSYVLGIDEDGNASTTNDVLYAYYEPVYNGGSNYDNWNTWTINQSSQLWSFQPVGTKGGENGANFFTLQDVKNAYPNAAVNEYTINMGSGNPGWSARVDAVATPSAIYNFEQDTSTTTTGTGTVATGTGSSSGNGGNRTNGSGGGSVNTGSTGSTGSSGSTGTTSTTGGQVLGAAAFNFTRDLFLGLTGADVTELQTEMIAAGYLHIPAATGYFGVLTRAAVAIWQAEHNITPAAGYFGPISRAKYSVDGGFRILTTLGCQPGFAFNPMTGQACQM